MEWIAEPEREVVITLTGNELCVLASFFDADAIYGVQNTVFKGNVEKNIHAVTRIVENFEKRQLLTIEMDGSVHLKKMLYQLLSTIAFPEHMAGTEVMEQGKVLASCYCYQKGKTVYSVRLKKAGRYEICRWDSWDTSMVMLPGAKTWYHKEYREVGLFRIHKEQVEQIRTYLNSFQSDKAVEYVRSVFSDSFAEATTEFLVKLAKGVGRYIQLYWCMNSGDARTVEKHLLVQNGDYIYQLELEDADYITLKRIDIE